MDEQKNLGSIIKYYRKHNRLKQDDLAIGICTSSYLSRIENGLVEADEEIYNMLFERLKLDYKIEKSKYQNMQIHLDEIYWKLLSNSPLTSNEIDFLQSTSDNHIHPTLHIAAKLVYARYLLSSEMIDEATSILNRVEDFVQWDYSRILELYIGTTTYYHLSTKNYRKILQREAERKASDFLKNSTKFERANYEYHLAFAAHRSYAFPLALSFIKKAESIFSHIYKPLFQLKLYTMKGVILNALGYYQQALTEYEAGIDLLTNVPQIASNQQWASIYNNIAFCYESQNQFPKALMYYEKSLYELEDLHVVINCMRTNLRTKNLKAVQQFQTQYPKSAFTIKHHLYQWDLIHLLTLSHEVEQAYFTKIENEAFTYFEQQQHYELILSYAPLFAQFYEERSIYKRASFCYKLAFNASETIRKHVNESEVVI